MDNKLEIKNCKEYLKTLLTNEDTIYTNCQHVSQSGMTRDIQLLFVKDDKLINLNYYVSKVLGNRIVNNGIRIGGCGMDMGFALVDNLASVLDIKLHQRWI